MQITLNPNKVLLAYALKLSNRVKKLDRGAGAYYTLGLDVLAVSIFDLFTKRAVNYDMSKIVHSEVRKYESEQKIEILDNAWKENRLDGRIFYVASSHADSAKDHKDWQGCIYVDRYWHNYDTDGKLGEFIRRNNIRTVQWVTGAPVYFITRPNCRHYFTTYTVDEILGDKYHIPHRKIGDRRLQTPKEANLQYYQDRLRLYETLYKKHQTDILKKQIEKTKLLIAKWKKVF